jgi:hypothetical protein
MVMTVEHARRDEWHLTASSSQASLVETFCVHYRSGGSHPAFGFSAGNRHSIRGGKHMYAHLQTLTVRRGEQFDAGVMQLHRTLNNAQPKAVTA